LGTSKRRMQTPPLHQRLLRHLVRPVRGGAGAVVIVFALLLYLAAKAGFIGIPLALLLTSWFFKYAYILFDHTARGFDEPPTLDIQMMNPVDEQRPLGQVLILGLNFGAVVLAKSYLGTAAAASLAVVAALLVPASAAVLGLEGNIFKAANPLAWIRVVRGMGSLYAAVLLVILGYALVLALLWRVELWLPLEIALVMFAWLSVFSFLGGALYERRDELGIEAWASPELVEERRREQELRDSERIVTEAYGLMRASSHIKCWQMLKDWVSSRGNSADDYRWLCERVCSWDDPRYITRLTEERVARLLTLKRTGEALDVVAQRLGVDQSFRPKTAADTLAIARMAVSGGGTRRVARTLLTDFATRFAGEPQVTAAQALARHLGSTAP
jgi:hypothetical protein